MSLYSGIRLVRAAYSHPHLTAAQSAIQRTRLPGYEFPTTAASFRTDANQRPYQPADCHTQYSNRGEADNTRPVLGFRGIRQAIRVELM